MKTILVSIILFSILISGCTSSKVFANDFYMVERIVDGDTLVLSKLGKVRLIGVDTPETKDPRKPVQYFGKEATQFLQTTAYGKVVRVEYDQNRVDRFGRTLVYLYFSDGTFLNSKIIEEGYGFAYTKYPFRMMDKMREAERTARFKKKGLWRNPSKPTPALVTVESGGGFQCVKKTCSMITSCNEALYLLKECGFGKLDGDKDGTPCEKLCP